MTPHSQFMITQRQLLKKQIHSHPRFLKTYNCRYKYFARWDSPAADRTYIYISHAHIRKCGMLPARADVCHSHSMQINFINNV